MINLQDRTVAITGGATGIGLALAKACGTKGANIVIGEPRENRLEEAASDLGAMGISVRYQLLDVTQIDQVESFADFAFDAFGEVALVVNNAGVGGGIGPVVESPMDAVRRVMEVNFFGVWHGCKVFGERLIAQGAPAAIYNTGSENSLFVAVSQNSSYVASKHAVYGLTESFRDEVPDFITVGMIAPGFVGSELIPEGPRDLGMPTDEFAAIILPQIMAGEFLVVSHGYNTVRIDERQQAVAAAYANYAQRQEGDEKYDIKVLMSQLAGN